MRSTLTRRTVAVTALAVTGLTGAGLSTASAANPAPKAHTSLSIRATHGSINPGGGDIVRGQLQSADGHQQGRRITLMSHPVGTTGWTALKRHRTNRHGVVAFQVTPTGTTRYQLVFKGNKQQWGSRSGIVTVRVRNTTSLVISVGAGSIEPGDSDTVDGVLSLHGAPIVGATVNLLGAPRGQRLAYKASALTGDDGSVSFSVTPPSTSHYALVFKRTATDAGARSAEAVIRVRMPSSLSIRARTDKKGHEIISGQLRGSDRGLAHRKVTLQARPTGSNAWSTVASRFTRRHGGVGFRFAAPTASTDYQLVFHGGPVYDGCQSGVVTVTVG